MRFLTSRYRPVTLILSLIGVGMLLLLYYLEIGINDPMKYSPSSIGTPEYIHTQSLEMPDSLVLQSTSDITKQQEKVFAERRALYEEKCQQGFKGGVWQVFYYQPAKLAVCHVQKVGCTFWKRIFHFLYGDTNGKNISSPFEIERYYVHSGGVKKTKTSSYAAKKALFDSFNKVLFVRDPWARIWSVYIDKFVLPDSWLDYGRAIANRRVDRSRRKSCPDDIGFVEYLDFALNVKQDAHWKPVHQVCSPCVFRPQYLGKMETFSKDSAHVLREVGLESLVQGHDHAHYAQDEVRMLTEYIFRVFEARPPLRKCLTHAGVAERLWMAFVLNGYIGDAQTFPKEEFTKAIDGMVNTRAASQKVVELMLKYHANSTARTSQQMKDYRRSVMVQHYRQAPRPLLEKIVKMYNGDFVLFDYEARPADIFQPDP
ncbi:carbohydrate sulfotransferase 10-like isoform X1 [Littorina saxatilis]